MKKIKLKSILENLSYMFHSWYGIIISIFVTGILAFEQRKYNLVFWEAEYYSDMLTAVITFLSIIIGIFGILIPAIISAREDKASKTNYFFENADVEFFSKCIKKIFCSGILSVICICLLYLQDIIDEKFYIWIFRVSIFLILYFCFGSYRFIGIMLSLLIGGKKEKEPKKTVKLYKNKTSDKDRSIINENLMNRNNSIEHKK